MTDYMKLIEALRCKVGITEEETKCEKCPYGTGFSDCDVERYCNDAAAAIEELKAQLPKRGEWVHGKELSRAYVGNCCTGIVYEDFRCSACGVVIEECEKPKWNYCPNCGAKMEVQDDKA